MSSVIDVLRDQYSAIINQKKDWYFFIFLADYIKFLKKIPELKPILDDIEAEKDKKIEEINKAEKEAITELIEIKENLLKEINDKKIKCDGLPEALSRLKDYEDGKINPDHYLSVELETGIDGLIEILPDKEKWAERYNLNKINSKYTDRFVLSFRYNQQKKDSLWGIYSKFGLMLKVMFESVSYLDKLIEDNQNIEDFQRLTEEMSLIKNDGKNISIFSENILRKDEFSSSTDNRVKEFKRIQYQFYLERLHFYLIKELAKIESKKEENGNENNNFPFVFDKEKSILIIKDIPIKIQKFRDQYNLLRIIDENDLDIDNECFFSDIADLYDVAEKEVSDTNKKFYNATYQINQKIARKTGIENYFLTTNQSFRRNPEYVNKEI